MCICVYKVKSHFALPNVTFNNFIFGEWARHKGVQVSRNLHTTRRACFPAQIDCIILAAQIIVIFQIAHVLHHRHRARIAHQCGILFKKSTGSSSSLYCVYVFFFTYYYYCHPFKPTHMYRAGAYSIPLWYIFYVYISWKFVHIDTGKKHEQESLNTNNIC